MLFACGLRATGGRAVNNTSSPCPERGRSILTQYNQSGAIIDGLFFKATPPPGGDKHHYYLIRFDFKTFCKFSLCPFCRGRFFSGTDMGKELRKVIYPYGLFKTKSNHRKQMYSAC